jgi:hypothetical protein
MDNINQLLEQIENLSQNDFSKFNKKYLNKINLKQKREFNLRFGSNLELLELSKIDLINQSFYYYQFRSQAHLYEFEINSTHKNKYSFQFYVDGNLEYSTQKIPEKKIFVDGLLNIKEHFSDIGNDTNIVDITPNDLHDIVNWLFLHKKFIYSNKTKFLE